MLKSVEIRTNYISKDCLQFGLKYFFYISVRQNVLEKGNHELVWPGTGTFKLTVRLPEDPDEASVSKEAVPEKVRKQGLIPRCVGFSMMSMVEMSWAGVAHTFNPNTRETEAGKSP